MQKRNLGIGLGQIYDPGIITLKPKKKESSAEPPKPNLEQAKELDVSGHTPEARTGELPKPREKPKWTKIQWKRPEDKATQNDSGEDSVPSTEGSKVESSDGKAKREDGEDASLKVEDEDTPSAPQNPEQIGSVKKEEELPTPEVGQTSSGSGGLFRKRKVPNAGNRGRRP